MKLSLFLGIVCFFMASILALTAISAFMQGQLCLGLMRLGLMIFGIFVGYTDLKDWKEER